MRLRIVSGGQTGVDRAALAWAIRHRVPHGGWCPCGRRSEDGAIPRRYRMRETRSASVGERTFLNVRDSDGTVIFLGGTELRGGAAETALFCAEMEKPALVLAAEVWTPCEAATALHVFLHRHGIRVLNVAGPRKSEDRDAPEFVRRVLDAAFPSRR